ncbi:MAG: hypothetical protein SGPRY_009210 [Prymnesium sp.]
MSLSDLLGPDVTSALASPGILACTAFYLFLLSPLLKRSGMVDTSKGAYRQAMVAYNLFFALYSALTFLAAAVALGWDGGYGQWLRDLMGDKVVDRLYQAAWPRGEEGGGRASCGGEGGKPASFLQKLHHSGAPWDLYFQLVLQHEGIWIFVSFNSFIHTFMYSYYAITAAGVRCPAKFVITAMQISQFIIGFVAVYPYAAIPCHAASKGLMFAWVFNYAYVGGVLLLFLHFFYMDNFVKPRKAKST